MENEPDELDRESRPEENVELDQTFVNLVVDIHLLDAPVSTKELVHLPAELGVDLPPQGDVCNLGDCNDDGDNGCQSIDRNGRNPSGCLQESVLDLSDLNNGVDEEEDIENAVGK